jgi:hypothetical protein
MNNMFTFLNPVEVSMEGSNNRRQRMYRPTAAGDLFPQMRNEVCMEFRRLNQFFPIDREIELRYRKLDGEYEHATAVTYHPIWPHNTWKIVFNTRYDVMVNKVFFGSESIRGGFFTGDYHRSPYQRTVAHEYGHIITCEIGMMDIDAPSAPSRYGETSTGETWAEAFVEVVQVPRSKWSLAAHMVSVRLQVVYWDRKE